MKLFKSITSISIILVSLFIVSCSSNDKTFTNNVETSAITNLEVDTKNVEQETTTVLSQSRGIQTEEIEYKIVDNNKNIYGVIHRPIDYTNEKYPLLVISHGLGGTADSVTKYANDISKTGFIVYRYDFSGGGENSRSEGKTIDMSPLTEREDLRVVHNDVLNLDYIDKQNVFLMGCSQGGLVTSITSPEYIDKIKAEILLYPAFVAQDMVHEGYNSIDEIPDSQWFNWLTLGKKYYTDMWDYDAYVDAEKFTKDILLIHGNQDKVVPISYAEKLANDMSNVEYHIIDGAGHGFNGNDYDIALKYINIFLSKELNKDSINNSITISNNKETQTNTKNLIIYFDYSENIDTTGLDVDAISQASLRGGSTGKNILNLKVMVDTIKEKNGADVHSIQVNEVYPAKFEDMTGIARDDQDKNKQFTLKKELQNIDKYDTIYFGVPVWWARLPQPVNVFLDKYDLSGKTIIPFGIHHGSRFGQMIQEIKRKEPNAKVLDGFTIDADTDNEKVKSEFSKYLENAK